MYAKPAYIHYFPPEDDAEAELDGSDSGTTAHAHAHTHVPALTLANENVQLQSTVNSSITGASPSFSSAPSQPASRVTPSTGAWTEVPKKGTRKAEHHATNQISSQPKKGASDDDTTTEDSALVNITIQERFNRYHPRDQGRSSNSNTSQQITLTNNSIPQYLRQTSTPAAANSWLSCPEFPTTAEVRDVAEPWQIVDPNDGGVLLHGNNLTGPWQSKDEYLSAHHEMLREEAVRPLREAISWVKANPHSSEDQRSFGGNMGIYEKVHITTITFSTRGIGIRVVFSLGKVGKNVRWDQSKRLITGSLVALTPTSDLFENKCIIAVVAARPLEGLRQNPPEIDLFFARADDIEIDPQIEFTMVEERASFFEASRHTMRALQKLTYEPFPLSNHLVDVETNVQPPAYLQEQPFLNMSNVFKSETGEFDNVDVINAWPENPNTELDKSQQKALCRILTKRLAIIQGPPGTGKTHVSVSALKILLANMSTKDGPIIVACQTNHALDQLLRHVAEFESRFVRLGGRSKDQGVVKERTLFALRTARRPKPIQGGMRGPARTRLDALSADMCLSLAPLERGKGLLDHILLRNLELLTPAQSESLENGDPEWSASAAARNDELPLKTWVGKQLLDNKRMFQRDEFPFPYEEADLEFEQLKELEAENCAQDDNEDYESLRGPAISLWDPYVGKPAPNVADETIREWLHQHRDLWKIKPRFRGAVYSYLQRQVKEKLLGHLRSKAKQYNENTVKFKAGGWEQDLALLKSQKIIGMTTTGLSKYRPLVAALISKVVLVEEAAETMEAPVIAACIPSLEHLILVGDHKQLRPQCAVRDLGKDPFNLNVSLFERMVTLFERLKPPGTAVEFTMLKQQRRMIPEVRRLLKPIYDSFIEDHSSMLDVAMRPLVPGMGGVNSFFYTHYTASSLDEQHSSINVYEAEMIRGFYNYLYYNGITDKQITVLTFYNGQRKLLLRKLKEGNERSRIFKVVTVDSYQGEENDIVILSLVRNNPEGNIGFLSVENRICVALSRAKRGFYLFGNGEMLAGESKLWSKVVTIMAGKDKTERSLSVLKCRVVFNIPIVCENHGRKTWINDPQDWEQIDGGCEKNCKGTLPDCGHGCPYNCHPFSHGEIVCQAHCVHEHPCGHPCDRLCGEPCHCPRCNIKYGRRPGRTSATGDLEDHHLDSSATVPGPNSKGSNQKTWASMASSEVKHHDMEMRTKLMELNLAAQANGLNHELRDRYLMDQEYCASGTAANSALQAARSAAVANQARRTMAPRSASHLPGPQHAKVSSEEHPRYIFKTVFNDNGDILQQSGPTTPPSFNLTVPKSVDEAPKVAKTLKRENLLIDLD